MLRPALVALLVAAPLPAADVAPAVYQVGVAEVDITPTHPVRLNGFGFRRTDKKSRVTVGRRRWRARSETKGKPPRRIPTR